MLQEFKKDLNQSLFELIDDEIPDTRDHHYVGKVVNNKDPNKHGRCRIRVFGVFDSTVPDGDLPWALPEQNFVGSNVGSFIVPPVGCIVRVRFDNDDIYTPVYTSKVIDKNNLPSQRFEDYPDTMVFFETDDGEYFKVNRKKQTAEYHHASGTTIKINKLGEVSIHASKTVDAGKSVALPGETPLGYFCTLPNCVYSGAVHTSNEATATIPLVKS